MEELVIVMVCLALNGLFSCFEMAFVTVTKPQLRQLAKEVTSPATKLLRLRENPERTLSIIQIGITLVGMVSAAVGGAGAEEFLAPFFERRFTMSENAAEGLAIAVVVLPLTILSVILGELVPKTIALRNPLRVSLLGARWIVLADRIFSPLVTFLETATKLILRLLPTRLGPDTPVDSSSLDVGSLSVPTQQYVANLAITETRRVREVMVSWPSVSKISLSDERGAVATAVIVSGHTRLLVVENHEVRGLLHTKEFIAMLATENADWHSIVRPVLFVKESEMALAALRLMQSKRTNLCVVLDDNAEPIGIVTLADIIEEVVGDIFDEDDDGRMRKMLATHAQWRKR